MDDRENAMAEQTSTTESICANSGSKKVEINVTKSRVRSLSQGIPDPRGMIAR